MLFKLHYTSLVVFCTTKTATIRLGQITMAVAVQMAIDTLLKRHGPAEVAVTEMQALLDRLFLGYNDRASGLQAILKSNLPESWFCWNKLKFCRCCSDLLLVLLFLLIFWAEFVVSRRALSIRISIAQKKKKKKEMNINEWFTVWCAIWLKNDVLYIVGMLTLMFQKFAFEVDRGLTKCLDGGRNLHVARQTALHRSRSEATDHGWTTHALPNRVPKTASDGNPIVLGPSRTLHFLKQLGTTIWNLE